MEAVIKFAMKMETKLYVLAMMVIDYKKMKKHVNLFTYVILKKKEDVLILVSRQLELISFARVAILMKNYYKMKKLVDLVSFMIYTLTFSPSSLILSIFFSYQP